MKDSLLETVQQQMGYPVLQKMDPNTDLMVEDGKTPDEDTFSQAAIPAVLTGFYKSVQGDAGAAAVLENDASTPWLDIIFGGNRKEVVESISRYSQQSGDDPVAKLTAIAAATAQAVQAVLPPDADIAAVKAYFKTQLPNILLYLPPALNMGGWLNDGTLDDSTHKMEGPISSLMQSIGAVFSTPETVPEVKP